MVLTQRLSVELSQWCVHLLMLAALKCTFTVFTSIHWLCSIHLLYHCKFVVRWAPLLLNSTFRIVNIKHKICEVKNWWTQSVSKYTLKITAYFSYLHQVFDNKTFLKIVTLFSFEKKYLKIKRLNWYQTIIFYIHQILKLCTMIVNYCNYIAI